MCACGCRLDAKARLDEDLEEMHRLSVRISQAHKSDSQTTSSMLDDARAVVRRNNGFEGDDDDNGGDGDEKNFTQSRLGGDSILSNEHISRGVSMKDVDAAAVTHSPFQHSPPSFSPADGTGQSETATPTSTTAGNKPRVSRVSFRVSTSVPGDSMGCQDDSENFDL